MDEIRQCMYCQSLVTASHMSRHYKSNKCQMEGMTIPEEIFDRNKQVVCKCGGKFTLSNKSKHEKSLKHIEFLKTPIKQDLLVDYKNLQYIIRQILIHLPFLLI